MNVIEIKSLEKRNKNLGVNVKNIPSDLKAKSVNLLLDPGKELAMHVTPVDVIFYVIDGSGTVTVGEEKREVKKGDFIDSPANIPHGWLNNSNEELSVLVIKLFS